MQENKFTQYVLDTQKIREKLVGKRWFYQGNYVFTEEMEASEEYFDNPPIKHIVWEFTEDGMFVKHVCGKPRLRFPYYLTSDLLVIDLTGNSLNNQALSGTRCTFVLREKGEELWACQFDEYVPMSESLAVRLLPETEGNTYRGAEYDGVARNMWEVIYGHLPIG